ncbi:hypothetical protein [Undibacterium sp. TJN19]|uniref:hypothetical protein n=1 Tax=Undibacterium sp. TJN19 TaxID=3413055 RepID=UPI003BF329BE
MSIERVIHLKLINLSDDSNTHVVIFQKNVASNVDANVIAWKVIIKEGPRDNHHRPFSFSMSMAVSVSDAWGNYTRQLGAYAGRLYSYGEAPGHYDYLHYIGPASVSSEVQVRNGKPNGAINAVIYRAGQRLAVHHSIAPGQTAAFEFKPSIWIGVASQVQEGQVMDPAIVASIDTELSLLDIVSADIIMKGGGSGASFQPFTFSLENIVKG